ncbi:MAG: hypothetical protein ABIP50_03815 [Candidatus Saccharimonadales bacterium]
MTHIVVHDRMQDGYEYDLTEPVGKHFAEDFTPDLTPKEMLELGVFGGVYMRDCRDEFPDEWFTHARFAEDKKDPNLNFFQVNASQSLAEWRRKGWIYDEDPRGWFQWYCRYYMGRRILGEDQRQIKRWKNMTRHTAQIKKFCAPGELDCRRRQRQAVLHWAYDSRQL